MSEEKPGFFSKLSNHYGSFIGGMTTLGLGLTGAAHILPAIGLVGPTAIPAVLAIGAVSFVAGAATGHDLIDNPSKANIAPTAPAKGTDIAPPSPAKVQERDISPSQAKAVERAANQIPSQTRDALERSNATLGISTGKNAPHPSPSAQMQKTRAVG